MRRPDLADEAFSRVALQALRKYRPGTIDNPRAWLLRVTRNVCVDMYREQQRDALAAATPIAIVPEREIAVDDHTPEMAVVRREAIAVAIGTIRGLPERLRTPFTLHVCDGLPYTEVADRMGLTSSSIRKRMQEAWRLVHRDVTAYRAGTPPRPGRTQEPAPQRAISIVVRFDDGRGKDAMIFTAGDAPAPKALEALQRYLVTYPGGWKKRLELARALRADGRLDAAVMHYETVLARNPRHVAAWTELATSQALLLRTGEAAEVCARAAAAIPRAAPLFALLRDAHQMHPSRVEALLTSLDGFLDDHAFLIANTLLDLGDPAGALRILGRDPVPETEAAAILRHDALRAKGQLQAAWEALDGAGGDDALALQRRLRLRCELGLVCGDERGAVDKLMARLREAAPMRAGTFFAEALLLLARDAAAAAARTMCAFTSAAPEQLHGWIGSTRIALLSGDAGAALRFAERAMQLASRDVGARLTYCRALAAAGDVHTAREAILALASERPWDGNVAITAAALLSPDPDRARQIARHTVEAARQSPFALLTAARLLRRAGAIDEARNLFERTLQDLPEDDAHGLATAAAHGLASIASHRNEARRWLANAAAREHAAMLFAKKLTRSCGARQAQHLSRNDIPECPRTSR